MLAADVGCLRFGARLLDQLDIELALLTGGPGQLASAICRASPASAPCRWVVFSPTAVVSSAISPKAVARPVAVTAPSAWPPTTEVR